MKDNFHTDLDAEKFNVTNETLRSWCPVFPDTTMYSFSTRLHENTEANDGAVIFGTVDLNIGDGYDEFTGLKSICVTGREHLIRTRLIRSST